MCLSVSYLWQRFLEGLHSQHERSCSAPIIVPEEDDNMYLYQFHKCCKSVFFVFHEEGGVLSYLEPIFTTKLGSSMMEGFSENCW